MLTSRVPSSLSEKAFVVGSPGEAVGDGVHHSARPRRGRDGERPNGSPSRGQVEHLATVV